MLHKDPANLLADLSPLNEFYCQLNDGVVYPPANKNGVKNLLPVKAWRMTNTH